MMVVCSEPDEILAVDPENGGILWKRSLADVGTADSIKTHKANGFTSHMPVTDGKRIYTVFGSGVVALRTRYRENASGLGSSSAPSTPGGTVPRRHWAVVGLLFT